MFTDMMCREGKSRKGIHIAKHEQVVRKEGKNYVFGAEGNPKFLISGQLPLGDIKNEGAPPPNNLSHTPLSDYLCTKARNLGGFSSNNIILYIGILL